MKQRDHIVFNSDKHEYTNINDGTDYKSVTKFISNYERPFDPTGSILIASARKQGKSPDTLKGEWKAKNDRSKVRGSWIHKVIEDYIGAKGYSNRTKVVLSVKHNDLYSEIPFDYLNKLIKKKCKLHIEDLLYLDNKQLAGQSDLVLEYKNHIEIEDWKTNEKDDLHKSYGNMLEIFKELPQCSYSTYAIQLVLYGMMAEKLYGKPCKKHTINHIYNGFRQYVIDKKTVKYIKSKLKFLFE